MEQPDLATIVGALRAALENHSDAAFVLDLDDRLVYGNAALRDALGVSETEIAQLDVDSPVRTNDHEFARLQRERARSGVATSYRGEGTRNDGSSFVTDVSLSPIRIDDSVAGVLGIARDVTAEAERASESRESEKLLRFAGRLARFGGWSVDAQSRRVDMTHDTRRIFGLPGLPDITELAWGLHPPTEFERFAAALERCLTDGVPFDLESVMVTTSGAEIWVRTIGEAERSSDGTIIRAHGAVWDISDQVAARRRETELEERLAATLNTISDGIAFLDLDWRITFVNPPAVRMFGRPEEELVGHVAWDLFPAALKSGFYSAFVEALATLEKSNYRGFYGETGRWFDVTAYPTPTGLAIYLRDVTAEEAARVEAEKAQERIAQQAALLDIANDAIIVRDLDGRIEYWNRAAEQIYGWSAEEVLGRKASEFMYEQSDGFDAATAEVLRQGVYAVELEQRHRSGRRIIADCRWQLVRDESGQPRSIMAVNSDITEYRREQELSARAQRLESLGTLAGGIAHDLNNVLTPILMSVQLLEHDEADSDRRELLEAIETAVKRGAEMVRQVLSFARGVEGRRIAVDLDRLLDDLVAFAKEALPSSISLEVDRPARFGGAVGDPTQMLQVLINLVSNARDAMPAGGTLRVNARVLDIIGPYATVSHDVPTGTYAVISVEDSGTGMPADIAQKIFEPFFTTKEHGRGTGLGLATSLAIARSHGGFMQLSTEEGRGTRFDLGLPMATTGAAESNQADDETAFSHGNGEVVLVVDDELAILQVCRQTLEAHGYRTLGASNGSEAIRVIEDGATRVDLLLTDMMMPVMDGAETSAYVEEHHPDIPIIAASGLTAHANVTDAVGMGISRFLPKPYTARVLLQAVHDTLAEHRERMRRHGPETEARK